MEPSPPGGVGDILFSPMPCLLARDRWTSRGAPGMTGLGRRVGPNRIPMPWRAGEQHGWPRRGHARYANGGSRKTRSSLSWPGPNGGPACCGRTATRYGSGTEEGGGRGGFHPPWFPGAGDLDPSILSGGFRPRGRWHRNGSAVCRGRAVRKLFRRHPTPASGREVCARDNLMGVRWNTEARAQAAV